MCHQRSTIHSGRPFVPPVFLFCEILKSGDGRTDGQVTCVETMPLGRPRGSIKVSKQCKTRPKAYAFYAFICIIKKECEGTVFYQLIILTLDKFLFAIRPTKDKTGVINDPLGQTHSHASSEHCFLLFWFSRFVRTDVRTTCAKTMSVTLGWPSGSISSEFCYTLFCSLYIFSRPLRGK